MIGSMVRDAFALSALILFGHTLLFWADFAAAMG